MKFLSKTKIVLFFVGAPLMLLFGDSFISNSEMCNNSQSCYLLVYSDTWNIVTLLILTILACATVSLVTLPLTSPVFEAWKRLFLISIVPILIGTYWIAGMPSEGGFGAPSLNELLYFPLFGLYYLLSIIVIIRAWMKSRKTQ